jgi:hypothetical protein
MAFVLGLSFAGGAGAEDRHHDRYIGSRFFIGLWEGIDTFDGSTQSLSVTCSGGKLCDVRLNDTFFSDCEGGLGFARGEGLINNGVLTIAEFLLTCSNGDLLSESGSSFVLDVRNSTLTYHDNSHEPPIVFHRISGETPGFARKSLR